MTRSHSNDYRQSINQTGRRSGRIAAAHEDWRTDQRERDGVKNLSSLCKYPTKWRRLTRTYWPWASFSKVIQWDFWSRIGSNLGNGFFNAKAGFWTKIMSSEFLHLIWIKPARVQNFELGLGSVWSKQTGLSWSHWKGGFSYPEMWYLDHSDPIQCSFQNCHRRWRWRWSWIAKHGISKSGNDSDKKNGETVDQSQAFCKRSHHWFQCITQRKWKICQTWPYF